MIRSHSGRVVLVMLAGECLLCQALVLDTVPEHAATAESNLWIVIPGDMTKHARGFDKIRNYL